MSRRLGALLPLALVMCLLAGPALAAAVHRTVLRPAIEPDGLLVILVIGSDIGPPHRPGNPLRGRADGVHLVAVDPRDRRATIVNFPRDSLIGGTKVNAHLVAGGPDRLRAVLQAYTGITIDHYALTTFRGIEHMVDGLGGVDVVVDQRMRDAFSGSDFAPGPQRLAGWQALAYVRDRKSVAGGDFGRTRHQGDLLRFVHAQVRARQADLPTLVRLVGLFARHTVTDIPAHRLLGLAMLAVDIDPAHVRQVPLGGSVGTAGRASVVRLHPGDTFDRIRAGHVGP